MSLRKILLDVAHTSGAKIYSILIWLAIVGLTARWLGPEGRGHLVVAMTWINLLAVLGHFSLGQVAIYRATQNYGERWLSAVFGSLLFLAASLSIVVIVGMGIAYYCTKGGIFSGVGGATIVVICIGLPFYIWEYHGSSLLISQGKITIYNSWLASGRTLGLILLYLIVFWCDYGVIGGVISAIGGQLLIAGGILYSIIKIVPNRASIPRSEVFALLKGGAKLHLNAIGVVVFGTIDVLLLNQYRGAEETAYYQLAIQLVSVMMIVPQAAAMVMYGHVSIAGADAAWPKHKRVLTITMAFVVASSSIAWMLAPLIVKVIGGTAFEPSVELFRWLLLATVGMTFSTTMAPQWIGRGLFIQAAAITILVGLIAVLTNTALIPLYGAKGAVFSAIITYSISTICNLAMMIYCNTQVRKLGTKAAVTRKL